MTLRLECRGNLILTHMVSSAVGKSAIICYLYRLGWSASKQTFKGPTLKAMQAEPTPRVVAGFPDKPITVSGTGSQKIDWFGTLRGRVGWLPVNPLLVYATGGAAYGRVETDVSFASHIPPPPGMISDVTGTTAVSEGDTRAGWTIGGGLEWMFAPNWSLKGEYLYYDLGTVSIDQRLVTSVPGIVGHMANIHSEAHYHGNIARVGVNYKFY